MMANQKFITITNTHIHNFHVNLNPFLFLSIEFADDVWVSFLCCFSFMLKVIVIFENLFSLLNQSTHTSILHRCDSIDKLKAQLPKMEQELKDPGKFKDFYQFTFNFAKNPGQKGLGKNLFVVLVACYYAH